MRDDTKHVKRVERKFVLGYLQAEKLYLKLKQALPPDPYAGYAPYRIRSLYFDSLYDEDYRDKQAGVLNRKKIRLRIYDESPTPIKLEVKKKSGESQEKISYSVERELAEALCRGNYRGLKESGDNNLEELYYLMTKEVYRPKGLVEYERKAFAVPTNDIRITFDSRIKSADGVTDLFADRSVFIPAAVEDLVVLEVKFNGFLLSYIKNLLNMSELYESSYSKYVAGRTFLG